MSRRRTQHSTSDSNRPARRRSSLLADSTSSGGGKFIECLENRLLFTTVITDTDPLTPAPSRFEFEYKDHAAKAVRVVVSGNMAVEFIFARVTKGTDKGPISEWNNVILGEPVAATSKEDGRDLFHVYVAQGSLDGYISIAEVAVPGETNAPRPMLPFDGNVTVDINPLFGDEQVLSTADGTGAITLGTRTWAIPEVDNSGNVPIRSDNFNGLGIAPASIANRNGRLVAGLSTAAGVSFSRFLFGGAVFGQVTLGGSLETFYCGALLTGVTEGQFTDSEPEGPGNFFVQGDIRNILAKGSIGTTGVDSTLAVVGGRTAPRYISGVDFDVRGRVGQIRTNQDYLAFGTIHNTNPGNGLRVRQQEYEFRINPALNRGEFTEFENGQLGDDEEFFNNDTFETAQFLGSINSKQLGQNSIQLNGLLQSNRLIEDNGDYYAVPLMAGQNVAVRLLSPALTGTIGPDGVITAGTEFKSRAHVGVFDPENRLIASDYSNTSAPTTQDPNPDPVQHTWISFVAAKPGIYRIAVAQDAPTFGESATFLGTIPYQLQVTGIGDLALGGLVANETISAPGSFFITGTDAPVANIQTVMGDLGALYSISDNIVGESSGFGINAIAQTGNLRAFDAMSIGTVEGTTGEGTAADPEVLTRGQGANLLAYRGSVGMIRSRGTDRAAAITMINMRAFVSGLPNIGGDVQWIVAPNTLLTDLAVNGNIGVVQTAAFGDGLHAGSLSANADGAGGAGAIDLIDVTLRLGTRGRGGPLISAGPGGNVRYIHVTPTPFGAIEEANVFRPTLFGGGTPEDTSFVPGQSFTYTDDSGANVTITPTLDQFFDPLTGQIVDLSGTLNILSYPIAPSLANPGGSGAGLAIIRASSTRGMLISSDGATEIGDLQSTGSGPNLVVDPFQPLGPDNVANSGDENFVVDTAATGTSADNSITLRGSRRATIDVYMTRGNNFNFINNRTPGELVNGAIGATGRVLARTIGTARSSVVRGMAVEGNAVADLAGVEGVQGNVFPYLQTKNAFTINGGSETGAAVLDVQATESIGNLMIHGIAQRITANADGIGVRGVHEGINGAVFTVGTIRQVNIGEGVLASGTGNFSQAGIYAISTTPGVAGADVANRGRVQLVTGTNADIRGDIASNVGIGRVNLVNGSIINSDIWVSGSQTLEEIGTGADLAPTLEFSGGVVIQSTGNGLTGNILGVNTTGTGGMIGMNILAFNIGPVTSTGGFGIINSQWNTTGTGRIDHVTADGFGMRGVLFEGGQSVGGLTAIGNGKRLNTTAFSPGVRFSETQPFDPFFGTKPNPLTDLHVVLGTNRAMPQRKGTSAAGSMDFVNVAVSRDIGPVKAHTIRVSDFNIPNLFTSLEVTDYVDHVRFLAGRAPVIAIGGDAVYFNGRVAGDVARAIIGGSFRGTSNLIVGGKLGQFMTGNTLYGNVYGQLGIDSIRVGTHYGSQGTYTPNNLREFITNGDMLTDSVLRVKKHLGRLIIGGDIQEGALVRVGTLGTKVVIGQENGTIQFE